MVAASYLSFSVHGRALCIFVANKILAYGTALASDLGAPGAGFLFSDRSYFGVQIRCGAFQKTANFCGKQGSKPNAPFP
jgi:hypothetical protein